MGLAFFVFVVVAGTIIGGYYAVTILPEKFAARALDRRLRDVGSDGELPSEGVGETVVKRALEGPLPGVDRLVAGTRGGISLQSLIDQSGVRITPSAVVLISVMGALMTGLLTFLLLPQPLIALLVAALVTVPCNVAEFGVQLGNLNDPIRVRQLSEPSVVGCGDS